MLIHKRSFLILITFLALLWLGGNDCLAQEPIAEFQRVLRDKAAFGETDFMALDQGETVIKLLPARDKREIAMCGVVPLQASAETFLQSFRENMTRQSNPAILEIGSLRNPPSIDDLQALTIEDRDIEELRQCVVRDCRLKLSATMIERLQREVDWAAPNYRIQVNQLLKEMLLDYVRDYLARGDAALIRYDDKWKEIRLADEHHELLAASSYESLANINKNPGGSSKPGLDVIENAFVWSKIRFGLKPVIAINHIRIYKLSRKLGAQVLILSKQIYSNHYFDSSIALTAFLNVPGSSPKSYLFYENRSRADGLEGTFGKIKRSIIEDKALGSLKSILHQTQLSLEARTLNTDPSAAPIGRGWNWRRWKIGRVHIFILLWITAFAMLIGLRAYGWKGSIGKVLHY
ncbi:MAG: hypothetical protein DMF74_16520 [Acidobacteria bacterium]|nr:MAG: hypothetical protein DMF74_16520 [Acidobacteriota bacterium]